MELYADKARVKTDKILNQIRRDIDEIYASDPDLLRISEKYRKYMEYVDKRSYLARITFLKADDKTTKEKARQAYLDQIRALTVQSETYNRLVRACCKILAKVNQKALDVINTRMPEIYRINYNQVAENCKNVGIAVYGEE